MNKAANTIHSPEDGPTKDCYGWDPMLDGDSDNTVSNQDLDMPDNPHGEIRGNTRSRMDQQFACPTHASIGKDFMDLEDTINDVLQQLGETVESDPAEEVQAPYAHKDSVQKNPILRAQTIEAWRKAHVAMALLCQPMPSPTPMGCCLKGAQGGTKQVSTMEVNGTDYHQLNALISDHPLVTAFLCGWGRTMNYRDAFNTVKQAKAFCREHFNGLDLQAVYHPWEHHCATAEHFNGLDLQAVYHPWEHHCATAAWGGRVKGVHIRIIKTLPKLYQAQSQMHAQQVQDAPLNQKEVVNAPPAIVARQGTNTQVGAPEEGADTTGVVNGTWSSDVLLVLLDLPYDSTLSTTVTLDTPFGASGYQHISTNTEAETDYERAQLIYKMSQIQERCQPGLSTLLHP